MNKVYVYLTGKVPSVFFSTFAKSIKLSSRYKPEGVITKDNVVELIDLTLYDSVVNILANEEFRNALKLDRIKAYDEFASEVDIFEDKYLDPPASSGGGTIYAHTLEFTGDGLTDIWTLTHNRNTNCFIANLYTLEDFGNGEIQVATEALIRGNDLDPLNAIDVVFTYPPVAENFRLVALVTEV